MRYFGSCFLSFVLFNISAPVQAQVGTSDAVARFDAVYNDLRNLHPVAVRSVESLVLRRDSATFILNGSVYLLSPVVGKTVAAVFVGEGNFRFRPALAVERRQLARFDEEETIIRDFESLFLLFNDDTESELRSGVEFTPTPGGGEAGRIVERCLRYLVSERTDAFYGHAMAAFLNNTGTAFFYSHFDGSGDPYNFEIDPFEDEEVAVKRKHPRSSRAWETITREHLAADYETSNGEHPLRTGDLVSLSNYSIESWIDGDLDFRATAALDVTSRLPGVRWVPLTLYSELDVDSVWTGGASVAFKRRNHSSRLWIPVKAGGDSLMEHITVFYHGELLERLNVLREMGYSGSLSQGRLVSMRDTWSWFPRYRAWAPASFAMTFHTPSNRTFVAAGERTSQETEGNVVTSTWTVPSASNVAFNIGEFEEYTIDDPRIPPVTLQVAEKFHRNLATTDGRGRETGYFLQQDNIEDMVGTDLANAMSFFQSFFGPSPLQSFNATEVPEFHGLAFPGLVHLSWLTYLSTDTDGNDELFRAHEVAHQWWGIGVGHASYRDQWLSEGFSQFAGAWYLQMARLQNEEYFDLLDDWADALIARGSDAGPIGVGGRVATAEHPGDYNLIVYKKGAWILHMLRNLLIDFETMNEDQFGLMMQHFYRAHVGQTASTDDFRELVEQYTGMPMDWFFNEWVYDSHIPEYEFAYRVSEQEDGSYAANLRVRQSGVPDDFKMIVPVMLDFGDQGEVRVRMMIEGPETLVDLELPAQPDRIVFNDLHSVLAGVRNVGWD